MTTKSHAAAEKSERMHAAADVDAPQPKTDNTGAKLQAARDLLGRQLGYGPEAIAALEDFIRAVK